eukprot:4142132-Pyramimonas_sp.AAC.1
MARSLAFSVGMRDARARRSCRGNAGDVLLRGGCPSGLARPHLAASGCPWALRLGDLLTSFWAHYEELYS